MKTNYVLICLMFAGLTSSAFAQSAPYYSTASTLSGLLRNVDGQATWFVSFYACEGGYVTLAQAFAIKEEVDA